MADPFVAEIRIFPFNFAPRGWAFCDGQLLPISQNSALFSLLGVTYGGNGINNFALPDMRGRAPMQPGPGPGGAFHDLGEMAGSDNLTLLESEIPAHSHMLKAHAKDPGALTIPSPARVLARSSGQNLYSSNLGSGVAAMSAQALTPVGGDQPHNNLMPYLTLNFCIALQGVFPPRW